MTSQLQAAAKEPRIERDEPSVPGFIIPLTLAGLQFNKEAISFTDMPDVSRIFFMSSREIVMGLPLIESSATAGS